MTTVTLYRSTDASAPVLEGQAGSLLALLDACLVNGYGSKSAAGWTKPFANSGNVGCYQNSPIDGTGLYLSVNDNGPGAATYQEARMTGYETLSAVATGTGQFPTTAQLSIGALVCRKAVAVNTTARPWNLIADDTVFYLFIDPGDYSNPTSVTTFIFGDIFSYKASDAYRCIIIGRNAENTSAGTVDGFGGLSGPSGSFLAQTLLGHYMDRSWTGVTGSVMVGKHIDYSKMGNWGQAGTFISSQSGTYFNTNGNQLCIGSNYGAPSEFLYPNGPDGGLWVSPIWIHHNGAVRGYLKGLWAPLHHLPLGHQQSYNGTGNMAGKSFFTISIEVVTNGQSPASPGEVHVETSSTWS